MSCLKHQSNDNLNKDNSKQLALYKSQKKSQLITQLVQLTESNRVLKAQLEETTKLKNVFEKDLDRTKKFVEDHCKQCQKDKNQLEEENKQLKTQLEANSSSRYSQAALEKFEMERSHLYKEITALNKHIDELQARGNIFAEEKARYRQEIDNQQMKLALAEREVIKLQNVQSRYEHQFQAQEKKIRQLEAFNKELSLKSNDNLNHYNQVAYRNTYQYDKREQSPSLKRVENVSGALQRRLSQESVLLAWKNEYQKHKQEGVYDTFPVPTPNSATKLEIYDEEQMRERKYLQNSLQLLLDIHRSTQELDARIVAFSGSVNDDEFRSINDVLYKNLLKVNKLENKGIDKIKRHQNEVMAYLQWCQQEILKKIK